MTLICRAIVRVYLHNTADPPVEDLPLMLTISSVYADHAYHFFLHISDTSPTYLQFLIVPCYYIICFGCLMGFTMHFYIIFGTNLLTGGPVQIVVFLPISVFHRKGISNRLQTEWNLWESYFLNKRNPGELEWTSRKKRGDHAAGRHAQGGRRAPLPRGFLVGCLMSTPSPLDHVCSENHVPEGFIPFGLRLISFSFETLK